jgi:hypothetical protein
VWRTQTTRVLHEFIHANRQELSDRCRTKVGNRALPAGSRLELAHGVSLFLDQLTEALRTEATLATKHLKVVGLLRASPANLESSRAAKLHGKELLDEGYTVDQVVHGYGDVCQAITELAAERNAPVTVEEFHYLNQLLDNAIADAVSSYGFHRDRAVTADGAQDLHERLGTLAERQRVVIHKARKAFEALAAGHVGVAGATGKVLDDCLSELQDLVDKSLPEIRLASGMTQSPDSQDTQRRN